jgi:hypothetical protein
LSDGSEETDGRRDWTDRPEHPFSKDKNHEASAYYASTLAFTAMICAQWCYQRNNKAEKVRESATVPRSARLVRAQLITAIAVKTIMTTPCIQIIGLLTDDFEQTPETGEMLGHGMSEIEQHRVVRRADA